MRLDPRYKFADAADEARFVLRGLFWRLYRQLRYRRGEIVVDAEWLHEPRFGEA